MRYVGNYINWIDPNWEQLILSKAGQGRPRDWPPSSAVESSEYLKYETAGYDLTAVNWWVYEYKDILVDIYPPWTKGKIHWWFTKLMPGQFMPMHTDPHTHNHSCKRYWIPIYDYHPGHIFVYNNEMITNYRAGDVYEYINSTDSHGAANIGHIPRIVLQVTEYDT